MRRPGGTTRPGGRGSPRTRPCAGASGRWRGGARGKCILSAMLWYIAAGSAIGGVGRYLLGGAVQRAVGTGFPMGTLAVNLTGSLLLGLFLRYAVDTPTLTPEWRAFLTIGFCGGGNTPFTFHYPTGAPLGGRP